MLNNLRKTVEYYKQQLSSTTNADTQKLELLQGLPFYCEWQPNNSDSKWTNVCCFNHAIGLPRKDGIEFQLFDYELKLFNSLSNNKYVWVKKASGLVAETFSSKKILKLSIRHIICCCFYCHRGSAFSHHVFVRISK